MLKKMNMTALARRDALRLAGAGAAAFVASSLLPNLALADAASAAKAIRKIIGDKAPQQGRITLEMPQIAENGNTVPIAFEVESPMTEADYVKAVHIFSEGNPIPHVASIRFSPASGRARVATRMRMAKTQNVIALAEMSDGSVYMAKTEVKVTIGGCGG
ncbi:MAG: thiosulfate oxidation carrier protein SoxY [Alphaproteobacteria bacterium]|jgi:sulfur-oxidizing protein SoxY|nr:thiosulfate oxidation carrier protein SoxY [Alphaproteobacteria bacterium]